MTGILLDTHAWIWYVSGNNELSKNAKKIITTALHNHQAYLAAISLWEICMLDKKQRIILEMPYLEWINKFLELTRVQILPITPAIAMESCHLPGDFHEDPADRMITATARVAGLTLVTRDTRILAYSCEKHVSTIKA
ncbi:MAG: type II toxin-antitoxin system VapC family toxin [Gammaproteobacteria bacterium]|nr:MAG: type II toxin-antitoxin system VapC family toxin [Gammaproteobacteria bacterium]